MKRAQFFLISLVLILISMFYVYTYIRSIDQASVLSASQSSAQDVQNIVNAIKTRNENYQTPYPNWWSGGWKYRKQASVQVTFNIAGAQTFEFDPNIPAGHMLTNPVGCDKELRLTDTSISPAELNSDVSAILPPCNITRTENSPASCGAFPCTVTFYYYTYYGNASANIPSYRGPTLQGTEYSATTGPEEVYNALCNHFKQIYPKTGAVIDCSIANFVNNKTNISLRYESPHLKFNGSIL